MRLTSHCNVTYPWRNGEQPGACTRTLDTALQLVEDLSEEISMPLLADMHLDYLGGLVGASPWAFSPNYFGGSELVVAGQVQASKQELGIQGQLLVACYSEAAANSSQKNFGVPGEPAYNVAHSPAAYLWAYLTIGELLEACFQARDTTACHLLAAKVPNLSLEYVNFVTSLTLLVVQLKDTSGKARIQTSTAAGPGTIMPSSTSRHGLRTGTTQSALVSRVSPKSRLVKPRF